MSSGTPWSGAVSSARAATCPVVCATHCTSPASPSMSTTRRRCSAPTPRAAMAIGFPDRRAKCWWRLPCIHENALLRVSGPDDGEGGRRDAPPQVAICETSSAGRCCPALAARRACRRFRSSREQCRADSTIGRSLLAQGGQVGRATAGDRVAGAKPRPSVAIGDSAER
jgi:hypothetical protein